MRKKGSFSSSDIYPLQERNVYPPRTTHECIWRETRESRAQRKPEPLSETPGRDPPLPLCPPPWFLHHDTRVFLKYTYIEKLKNNLSLQQEDFLFSIPVGTRSSQRASLGNEQEHFKERDTTVVAQVTPVSARPAADRRIPPRKNPPSDEYEEARCPAPRRWIPFFSRENRGFGRISGSSCPLITSWGIVWRPPLPPPAPHLKPCDRLAGQEKVSENFIFI